MDELSDPSIQYMAPFIPYDKKNELKRRLYEVISEQREKYEQLLLMSLLTAQRCLIYDDPSEHSQAW